MPIKWLDEISQLEFSTKTVLLRLDLNVPMDNAHPGHILDATRIENSLPTIRRLLRAQAKLVICSHLGQPKGKFRSELSLEPVALYLRDLLDTELFFVHDSVGDGVSKLVQDRRPGEVIFLENLRFHPGEENNDPVFAKMLARLADIYVNDAFGAIHRNHASISGVTSFFSQSLGGLLLKKELAAFDIILHRSQKPFIAVIGAAKISSKIGILTQLLKKVDTILIGGAMAYSFLRVTGENVGKSLVEEDKIPLARNLLNKALELGVNILLPVDHVLADGSIISANEFLPDQIGCDIGPKTRKIFADVLNNAKTVFWNGPLGMYENDLFLAGTAFVAEALPKDSCYSVIAGGDSIAAIKKAGFLNKISFASTGGGAGLELLEGRELPGLKALGYYEC